MKVSAINNVSKNINAVNPVVKFTNDDAAKLIKKELSSSMPEKTINNYITQVKMICEKLKIQLKDLPINSEHKGTLSAEKSKEFCQEVFKLSIIA